MNKVLMVEELYESSENPEERAIRDHEDTGSAARVSEHAQLRDQLAAAVAVICPHWLLNYRDDIVQLATMAMLRQQKKGEGERRFTPSYLRKVAHTAVVDEIRRRRSRGEVPLETASSELSLEDGQATPERGAFASEIARGIRGCLERLASPRRVAVTLHLLGYKVPEIAKKMGWTRKQAENLAYRGLRDLRECLEARGLKP